MQSHVSYSSCSCFVSLTGPYKFVYLVLEQFKFGSLSTILSYWPLDVQHGTSWQRTLWGFWELESLLSTKMAKVIRSLVTAWNWVTVHCPGSYRGFPRQVSLGTGLARVDQRYWVLVLCVRCRSWLQKQTHECCQHCFRGCRSGRSVIRPYATHCNKSVCKAVVPEGSLFWSWLTKKPAKCLLKTT